MATKLQIKINHFLLLFHFALYPLGQIPKALLGFHLFDLSIFILIIFNLRSINFKKLPQYFNFLYFIWISYILSFFVFPDINHLTGLIYTIRTTLFFFIPSIIKYLIAQKIISKQKLLQSLYTISIVGALLAFLQYLFVPDLRNLAILGWDDHLYRLAGTHLDPNFMGIILVFGLLISFQKKSLPSIIFLLFAIMLTYSRATYSALIISTLYFYRQNISFLKTFSFLIIFAFSIFLLPRPIGEGIRLERTASINARLENYQESINLFKKSPVFGVGFNNICEFKSVQSSHSCSGLDNSFLFILATTGILGSLVFAYSIWILIYNLPKSKHKNLFLSSCLALGIHSIFNNTLFYNFALVWIMTFLGVLSVKENK